MVRLHTAGERAFFGDLSELAHPEPIAAHLAPLRKADRVVHANPSFGGPEAVLACPSRYTDVFAELSLPEDSRGRSGRLSVLA